MKLKLIHRKENSTLGFSRSLDKFIRIYMQKENLWSVALYRYKMEFAT